MKFMKFVDNFAVQTLIEGSRSLDSKKNRILEDLILVRLFFCKKLK